MAEIRTVGVYGSGTMGSGIAQVFAQSGLRTLVFDVAEPQLAGARAKIEGSLNKFVSKGKLSADEAKKALERLRTTMEPGDLADCDLVVEAVPEQFPIKAEVFRTLDTAVKPGAILASNTSSISITKLAAVTKRPKAFIGMHFMNPVPLMPLVEVIRGHVTSDETTRAIADLTKKLGKTPVEANDYPGFIANRVLLPMINEAVYALYEGVGTKEAIDTVMKLGMNHPMGPLELADFIGLDVCLAILEVLHDGLGDPKYRPCPLLRKMVEAGQLGRKSGQGFYAYA